MMKIGFIGCGNMATAMIHGILQSGLASERDLMASAKTAKTQKKITDELHLACGTNEETASFSDVLFLAVKPQFYEDVILSVRDHVKKEALIVTLAPGKTLEWLGSLFGEDRKIIRTMPNTPAMVGEGMTAVCPNALVSVEETDQIMEMIRTFGKAEILPEHLCTSIACAIFSRSGPPERLTIE